MAELALLDATGTVVNVAVVADPADELLTTALVAAGNHTAGVAVPAELEATVGIGWTYSKRSGFLAPQAPPDPDA